MLFDTGASNLWSCSVQIDQAGHSDKPVQDPRVNCTCRRLQNDLRYSRQYFTSGSRHCEDRSGINSDGERARFQFVVRLLTSAAEVIEWGGRCPLLAHSGNPHTSHLMSL